MEADKGTGGIQVQWQSHLFHTGKWSATDQRMSSTAEMSSDRKAFVVC